MALLVKIRWIMVLMRRSMKIMAVSSALLVIPSYSFALAPMNTSEPSVSASPVPSTLSAPITTSSGAPMTPSARRAAKAAALATYRTALMEAQNGRDLAFADANATLVQAMSTAGKDRAARAAARAAYKQAAQGIVTAYRQSIANANAAYKAALQAIK